MESHYKGLRQKLKIEKKKKINRWEKAQDEVIDVVWHLSERSSIDTRMTNNLTR